MTKSPLAQPKKILAKLLFLCERWLYRHGYTNPDARRLIGLQFVATGFLLALGLVLAWATLWVLWAGVGAVLAVVNFYFLARKIQMLVPNNFSRANIIKLVLNFYVRLLLTAVALFVFIVVFNASIPALLTGISLSAGTAMVFALTRLHLLKRRSATGNDV